MDESVNAAYLVVFMTKPEMNSYSTLHQKLLVISKSFKSRPLSWSTSAFTHLIITTDSINDLWRKFFTDNESDFGQDDHCTSYLRANLSGATASLTCIRGLRRTFPTTKMVACGRIIRAKLHQYFALIKSLERTSNAYFSGDGSQNRKIPPSGNSAR